MVPAVEQMDKPVKDPSLEVVAQPTDIAVPVQIFAELDARVHLELVQRPLLLTQIAKQSHLMVLAVALPAILVREVLLVAAARHMVGAVAAVSFAELDARAHLELVLHLLLLPQVAVVAKQSLLMVLAVAQLATPVPVLHSVTAARPLDGAAAPLFIATSAVKLPTELAQVPLLLLQCPPPMLLL